MTLLSGRMPFLGTTTIPSRMKEPSSSFSLILAWLTMRTPRPMRAFLSMMAPSINESEPTPIGGMPRASVARISSNV